LVLNEHVNHTTMAAAETLAMRSAASARVYLELQSFGVGDVNGRNVDDVAFQPRSHIIARTQREREAFREAGSGDVVSQKVC